MNSENTNFLSQTHCINSYQTDLYARATPCALFQIMLEAAWLHAQKLDWGYDDLQNHHMFWVLSRVYIEFDKYPSWQDEITLKTWSAGTDGMYAFREFVLEDKSGEVILRANSSWLILNQETKKIVLLKDQIDTFPRRQNEDSCREPKRIRPNKHTEELIFSPVKFSDLDLNRHFNSVKSLERILDFRGVNFLKNNEPATIEMNYLKEGLPEDSLAVVSEFEDEKRTHSTILRESDRTNLCTAKISWRERFIDPANS